MVIPEISVIVPVHNSFKYLGDCLDSLLNQTYQNFEIICINDGSCDGSGLVLKKYAQKDNRIKIKTTECHGVGNARNVGLDLAKGKYIFFMDSDDVLHKECFSYFMAIAEKTNADIICGKYRKVKNPGIQDNKKLSGDFSLETNPISCFGQRPPKIPITVWNKLYKKEVIGKVRFLPDVFYEDTAFTLEIFSKAHTCALTSDATYLYRTGNKSIMRSQMTEQKINDFRKVLKKVDEGLKGRPEAHRLIFSTYLNPELMSLVFFWFGMSKHSRDYARDQMQPIFKKVQQSVKSSSQDPVLKKKKFYKTRLFFKMLTEKMCGK